jgi:hypothetical protein
MALYRNNDNQYSLVYDGKLHSSHNTAIDAINKGLLKQQQDYKQQGEAKRFTVNHEQHGLQHEEDGYSK